MRKLFIILFLISAQLSFGQKADEHLYNGNKLYGKGQFKQAADEYQKSFATKKSHEAMYNLGNALYQQKDFEKAGKQFSDAAKSTKDRSIKSFSQHNAGNSFLEQKKWDEAIQHYKESLKINPNSSDTKYNLAYAQKMKKKEEQDKKKDDKQDKQQQNQQQKEQEKKDQEKKEEDKKEQENNKPKEKPEQKEQEKPKPMPSKLTKEQADQLLNALNQEEKKLREKKDKGNGQPVKLEKDW